MRITLIPDEHKCSILSHLQFDTLVMVSATSKSLAISANDNSLWKMLCTSRGWMTQEKTLEYQIEEITDERGRGANREFQVKWRDFAELEWTHHTNIDSNCVQLVQYRERKKAARARRQAQASAVYEEWVCAVEASQAASWSRGRASEKFRGTIQVRDQTACLPLCGGWLGAPRCSLPQYELPLLMH